MASVKIFLSVVILAAAATTARAAESADKSEKKSELPNIVILATGGTIAGQGESGGGYTAGQFKVEDLIKAVPGIDKMANLRGEQVANIGSQDMNDKVWLKLAKRTNELLARDDVDGIVVTHGTDTMEETAYFLDLVVKSDKPVVLVGSMRPATAISADGPGNLKDAVMTAACPGARGRGVLVVMNDTIHNARDVTKTNTTSLDTFTSPERGPAGRVDSENVVWFEKTNKRHTSDSQFSVAGKDKLPRVDIIYAHANMDGKMIDDAVANGAKGLVIAGVGDGNMSKSALDAACRAVHKGVVVVRSTQLPSGIVLRNSEVDDDKLGFIASGELNPRKSRVLLQQAIASNHRDAKQVQHMFQHY